MKKSYITKTNLTLGPQLGSQMFQYAGLYAVSKRLNMDIVFLKEYINLQRGIKLFDAFDLDPRIVSSKDISFNIYELKETECDNEVFGLDPKLNWDIRGWFHLYYYFDRFTNDVKHLFSFKSDIQEEAKKKMNSIMKDKEGEPIVSVHFRRGDYLQVSSLNLSFDYYNAAFQKISNYVPYFNVLVFSDDIAWCKENINGENVYFSENNSNYVDMCMMSMCDHNIIANSTFSWWGAHLNNNPSKIVICPEYYLDSKSENFINKNYYPKDWISLKEK